MRGLVAELAERGLKVDYRSVWNFVHAEKLSFKKRMARFVCKGFVRGDLISLFAVETLISGCPPHRSERAQFGHSAPTSGV